jgi:hypothetical protein
VLLDSPGPDDYERAWQAFAGAHQAAIEELPRYLAEKVHEIMNVEFRFGDSAVAGCDRDGPQYGHPTGRRLSDYQDWERGAATFVRAPMGPAGLEALDTLCSIPQAHRRVLRLGRHGGRLVRPLRASPGVSRCDTCPMVDDTARDRAIYHALKAADEVAAALQTHLIEEHGADPERAAPQSSSSNSLKLLRQAREHLGEGLRAVEADHIAESDGISLRSR